MKKLVAIFKNKDIRDRILFTIMIFFVYRIGCNIVVPGVTLSDSIGDTDLLSLMNLMGGGALQNFSVFALGGAAARERVSVEGASLPCTYRQVSDDCR